MEVGAKAAGFCERDELLLILIAFLGGVDAKANDVVAFPDVCLTYGLIDFPVLVVLSAHFTP